MLEMVDISVHQSLSICRMLRLRSLGQIVAFLKSVNKK